MSKQPLRPASDPWLRRVDHLICEVDDIERATTLFTETLGFPLAWPIGRFWPQGLTSGVALGGLNLEFIQLDEGSPSSARISTIVFEPISLDKARDVYDARGLETETREKWEEDFGRLRLRGFSEEDAREAQLICRNLYPRSAIPFDFFLCEYAPFLKARLAPSAFPNLPQVKAITIRVAGPLIEPLFGLPEGEEHPTLLTDDTPGDPVVTEIETERGPIDFGDWPAEFRFV